MSFSNLSKSMTSTCYAVADVLDIYRVKYSNTLTEVGSLLGSLQRLETDGAFNTADHRARCRLHGVLNRCTTLANELRKQIEGGNLENRLDISRDLVSLKEAIDSFQKTYGKLVVVPEEDDNDELTHKERQELEELRARFAQVSDDDQQYEQKIGEQNTRIAILEKESADLTAKFQVLKINDDSKLRLIRRLHAAITTLGPTVPIRHRRQTWHEVTAELPTIFDKINEFNEKLRDLEPELRFVTKDQDDSRKKGEQSGRRRGKTEDSDNEGSKVRYNSKNVQDSDTEVGLRSPSPTESNISLQRDPPTRSRTTRKHRKGMDDKGRH